MSKKSVGNGTVYTDGCWIRVITDDFGPGYWASGAAYATSAIDTVDKAEMLSTYRRLGKFNNIKLKGVRHV